MLFHSHVFLLVFLPSVLAAYYLAGDRQRLRQWLLIAASFVFYGYWDVRLLPLLAGSIAANWLFAWLFFAGSDTYVSKGGADPDRQSVMRAAGPRGRWIVAAGIAVNLALLAIFKYADFFAASLAAVVDESHAPWSIVLPLGISFFTFQQISYLADLRRGRASLYAFRDYAQFVCFFPQLIAGPIVRHNELIPQFDLPPRRDGLHERLSRGLALLVIGLMKKTLVADNLMQISDPFFASAAAGNSLSMAEAWVGTCAFGLQIYFDFSAYSDMAIGLALMFGFSLPINFDAPYRAASIRDFWRRWHMTLSRFLRDYLYIPLGGSRHGEAVMIMALMTTMLLGGLWHGAGWTFVAWGAVHGVALAINHGWQRTGLRLPAGVGWLLTMLVVFVAWVLFRAETFAAAMGMIWAMFGGHGFDLTPPDVHRVSLMWVAVALALFGPTSQRLALDWMPPKRLVAIAVAGGLLFAILQVGAFRTQEFIYFQF